MAESRENSILKSFIMSMAIAEIARYLQSDLDNAKKFSFSEVKELFDKSLAEEINEEDSEDLEDVMEITAVIKECERVVQVRIIL